MEHYSEQMKRVSFDEHVKDVQSTKTESTTRSVKVDRYERYGRSMLILLNDGVPFSEATLLSSRECSETAMHTVKALRQGLDMSDFEEAISHDQLDDLIDSIQLCMIRKKRSKTTSFGHIVFEGILLDAVLQLE